MFFGVYITYLFIIQNIFGTLQWGHWVLSTNETFDLGCNLLPMLWHLDLFGYRTALYSYSLIWHLHVSVPKKCLLSMSHWWKNALEMFYLNTIEQLLLFHWAVRPVRSLDRLLTGLPIRLVFQNLRWNSNKTSLFRFS